MRPIAVFRFSPTEGPAHFAEWLDRESLPWEMIAIDAGAMVPSDARRYAGIGMMGGPMSVTDALAWIGPLSGCARRRRARRAGDRPLPRRSVARAARCSRAGPQFQMAG
jgi:hypothetical protein